MDVQNALRWPMRKQYVKKYGVIGLPYLKPFNFDAGFLELNDILRDHTFSRFEVTFK